jgi:nucleoside-diphosphate-sugar epimerase
MTILLVGHEGYIGSGLLRYLQAHHKVIGWGRKQDVCTLSASILKELKITAVVNCATVMDRVSTCFNMGSESDVVNIGGTRALVAALKGSEIRLIHLSTKDVFGEVYSCNDVEEGEFYYKPKFLVDDDQPFQPKTIYAKTKLVSEFIAESHPWTVVIRLSSCYTDFDHHRGNWIVSLTKTLLQKKPVTVTNGGKQFRDLLHVDDLGKLVNCILESDNYNVKFNAGGGSGNILSILEVIRMIEPTAEIVKTYGSDYGFAFNNRFVTELFAWRPRILFDEKLLIIRKNINSKKSAGV